jgi:uncharacterized protein YgbK (DUF1537 family)
MAKLARLLVEAELVGGLLLTGGDTAAATLVALNAASLMLRGEIEPGIPWGVIGRGPFAGLPVVTKAGGFGDGEAIVAAVRHLRGAKA